MVRKNGAFFFEKNQTQIGTSSRLVYSNVNSELDKECLTDYLNTFYHIFLEHKQDFKFLLAESEILLLIPITGAIEITNQNTAYITAGEVYTLKNRSRSFCISNPLINQKVDVLILILATQLKVHEDLKKFNFMESNFHRLFSDLNSEIWIYKLSNRDEKKLGFETQKNTFIYCIWGAFEIEGRLIQKNEGLTITNTSTLEIESIEENSILIFFKENVII
ncbi:pirin family protein [Lacihabitans lacunae]|uniref:Quercetin 2,3-dioxygenase C-terminal cupin domain-containing protein n=1 Tax=Lacihabitans lacunae TaxID=1028214 RepID=A0ABV7Z0S1_9BACT